MPVNYLVRLSQRENNWRSYLQQNCSPGLEFSVPRAICAPPGGWWVVPCLIHPASQPARCHNYILTQPSVIVLLPVRHTKYDPPHPLGICNVSCWFAKPGQLRVRGNYCNWLKHFLTQFWLCSANSTVIAQINNGNAKTQLWFSQFFAVVSSWECPVKRLSQWEPRDLVSRVDWSASGVYKVQAWILWQQQSEWWMVTTPTLLLLLTQNSFCLLMVCINE